MKDTTALPLAQLTLARYGDTLPPGESITLSDDDMSIARNMWLALILLHAAAVPAANLQDGLWEISTVPEGVPAGAAQTMQQCLDSREIESFARGTPQIAGLDAGCRPSTRESGGTSTSWTIDCAGPPRITGSGEATYSGTSFNGASRLSMDIDGQKLVLRQRVSGRRIGDCRR